MIPVCCTFFCGSMSVGTRLPGLKQLPVCNGCKKMHEYKCILRPKQKQWYEARHGIMLSKHHQKALQNLQRAYSQQSPRDLINSPTESCFLMTIPIYTIIVHWSWKTSVMAMPRHTVAFSGLLDNGRRHNACGLSESSSVLQLRRSGSSR